MTTAKLTILTVLVAFLIAYGQQAEGQSLTSNAGAAQQSASQAGPNLDIATEEPVLALGGYDIISYYNGDAGPVKGGSFHTYVHDGYLYRFANAENRAIFAATPNVYAPEFGHSCAFALSQGIPLLASGASNYTITEDKLYLFSSDQARANWLANPRNLRTRARAEWTKPENRINKISIPF